MLKLLSLLLLLLFVVIAVNIMRISDGSAVQALCTLTSWSCQGVFRILKMHMHKCTEFLRGMKDCRTCQQRFLVTIIEFLGKKTSLHMLDDRPV